MAHIAAGTKHPDNMNRKEHMAMIASFENEEDAVRWWLNHCARISKAAFLAARNRSH